MLTSALLPDFKKYNLSLSKQENYPQKERLSPFTDHRQYLFIFLSAQLPARLVNRLYTSGGKQLPL